jgi:hypothetical protein
MGIEPTYAAWKAAVLPLNYTRVAVYITIMREGFQLSLEGEKRLG